jgi:hypothetical protein
VKSAEYQLDMPLHLRKQTQKDVEGNQDNKNDEKFLFFRNFC